MADKWTSGVITNAGISMLGEVMSGGELIISRAALGGGTVEVAALMAQAELTQPLTVPVVIAQKKLIEGKGLDIRIQIRNTGVSAAQVMKQVGIFAKIGADGEEKLFAIMQDDVGDEIPSAVSYPDFMLEFTSAVAVSNTGNITVSVSGSAVVTREDLEAALDETTGEITRLLEGKADKSYVDSGLAGKADKSHVDSELAGKAEKSDVPTKVSDLVNDSGFITSPDGGNAATLEGKTASDFAGASDLTTHKNDTTVHITAEERVKWDGKADKSDIPTKLPADGGNADTLDGKHANDIAYNPNILINSNFRLNQNKATTYNADWEYTVDRWQAFGHVITVADNGIVIKTRDDADYCSLLQRNRVYGLLGEKIALSVKINGEIYSGVVQIAAYDTAASVALPGSSRAELAYTSDGILLVQLYINKSQVWTINWVKAEIGDMATPYQPPNYDVELLKIQGYPVQTNGSILLYADNLIDNNAEFTWRSWNPTDPPVGSGGDYVVRAFKSTSQVITILAFNVATNEIYKINKYGSTWDTTAWRRLSDGGNAASVNGVSVQDNAQAIGLHQMFVGTADAASVTIPAGAWYGRHS